MTVGELKKLLSKYPDDMEVVKSSDAHDHCDTTIVSVIFNVIENTCVYSNYHECYKLSDDIDSDDETKEFVIL
jgi:hypothetical protein